MDGREGGREREWDVKMGCILNSNKQQIGKSDLLGKARKDLRQLNFKDSISANIAEGPFQGAFFQFRCFV